MCLPACEEEDLGDSVIRMYRRPYYHQASEEADQGDMQGGEGSSHSRRGDNGGGDDDPRQHRLEQARRKVERLVQENAVVVFSKSDCCMSLVVKRLFSNLGVGPFECELDQESDGADIEAALQQLLLNSAGSSGRDHDDDDDDPPAAVPTVFVGGELLGGVDTVMSTHLSGDLVSRLRNAGALWL